MKSPLALFILQAVAEKPNISGYKISEQLDQTHAWKASHQQVYRDCGRLEQDGLLRHSVQKSTLGRPDSKIYSLTPAGEELVTDLRIGNIKDIKLGKQHTEATVMVLMKNERYFVNMINLLEFEQEQNREELKRTDCPFERVLIERSMAMNEVELRFAGAAIEAIAKSRSGKGAA